MELNKRVKNNNSRIKLSLLHQNVQEIGKKINRLDHLIEETNPDVIILSEHGLKKDQMENTRLPKYCLKTHFSREDHRKGGVAIFVKDELTTAAQPVILEHNQELTCEMAMIKVTLGKKQLYILGVYRTPAGQLEEALTLISATIEDTRAENYPILVMGDINVDRLKKDRENEMLNDTLSSHNIIRLPLPPTRVTPTSKTSIDFICTNMDTDEITTNVIHAGVSDHTAQVCEIKYTATPPKQQSAMCRLFNQRNLNLLKTQLENEDWQNVHTTDVVETAYNNFLSTVVTNLNSTCPRKKVRPRRRKAMVYADQETNHLKQVYLQGLRKYELTGALADKNEMSKAKKDYDMRLKSIKRQVSANHIANAENKSKALWQVINSERKNNQPKTTHPQLAIGCEIVTDTQTIANHFNHFFTTIAETTLKNQPKVTKQPLTQQTTGNDLTQLPFTNEREIEEIIDHLKPKTSSGLDEISAKILKHCKKALIPPLVKVTNLSLTHGLFPTALKQSKVYPKLKSGNQTETRNYRPISLISTFSKVIEKVVLKRLMDHCEHNNLLTVSQHGFIKGRSTTSAIIKLAEFIIDSLEEKNLVTGIMLDFSKAFDCLGHELILNKLEQLGVKGQALAWFKSYLEGRSQVVEIQDTQKNIRQEVRSNPLPINRGVPQGSVLGPVLFILLTNDMPQYLGMHCTPLMYADDTTLLFAESSPNSLAVNSYIALNKAYQYCHENDLVVNAEKTKQLAFGRRQEEVPELPEVSMESQTKFLGLTFDSTLSWNDHVDTLSKKLSSCLYVLKRVNFVSDYATTKTAYHALFESHLRYGLAVWGGTSAGNLNRILLLQKRAIRIMVGLGPRESCRNAFKTTHVLTVIGLYIKEVIMHVTIEQLQRGHDLHTYNTRHASNFHLPLHHTTSYERKPSYMGRKLFNLLPEDLKMLNVKKLKTALTNWLINRPFYSIDEFLDWRNNEDHL